MFHACAQSASTSTSQRSGSARQASDDACPVPWLAPVERQTAVELHFDLRAACGSSAVRGQVVDEPQRGSLRPRRVRRRRPRADADIARTPATRYIPRLSFLRGLCRRAHPYGFRASLCNASMDGARSRARQALPRPDMSDRQAAASAANCGLQLPPSGCAVAVKAPVRRWKAHARTVRQHFRHLAVFDRRCTSCHHCASRSSAMVRDEDVRAQLDRSAGTSRTPRGTRRGVRPGTTLRPTSRRTPAAVAGSYGTGSRQGIRSHRNRRTRRGHNG